MERVVNPSVEPQYPNQNSGSSQRGSVVLPAAGSAQIQEQSPLTAAIRREDSQELQNSVIKVRNSGFLQEEETKAGEFVSEQQLLDGSPSNQLRDNGAPAEIAMHQELEISQGSYIGAGGKEVEDEISKLINESYQTDDSKDLSVVYKNDKLYDQPKKAIYGI